MTTSTDAARTRAVWMAHPMVRGGALVAGAVVLSALVGWSERTQSERVTTPSAAGTPAHRAESASRTNPSGSGRMTATSQQLDRANSIAAYSAHYQIPADLSTAIYDISRSEGVEPSLAFRLVKVESNFVRGARSSAGAIGYTQVQLPTARHYDAHVTAERLMERDTNLRLGFRFLKDLMRQFNHDVPLALLAYNRGPGRVNAILAEGGDPTNGYSDAVLRAYRPAGRSAVQ